MLHQAQHTRTVKGGRAQPRTRPAKITRLFRRAPLKAVIAAILALTMAPLPAFAASEVTVAGADYTTASSGSGSNGGTWSWDGANDMALNNYNGGAIAAKGDLTIGLTGTNTVTANTDQHYGSAVYVADGDLTITGEGSLEVTAENVKQLSGAIETCSTGVDNCDINIEDTTVTVNATSNNGAYGIAAEGGDVNISGSTVNVTSNAKNSMDWNAGIAAINDYGNGKNVDGGHITITNSAVTTIATGNVGGNYGIMAADQHSGNSSSASVSIINSKVNAAGPGGAIISSNMEKKDNYGTITIINSTISTPDGAGILSYEVGTIGGLDYGYGQIIGTGTDAITWQTKDGKTNPAIATTVQIDKVVAPTPVDSTEAVSDVSANPFVGVAYASNSTVSPKTGDFDFTPFAIGTLVVLIAGAGCLVLARCNQR